MALLIDWRRVGVPLTFELMYVFFSLCLFSLSLSLFLFFFISVILEMVHDNAPGDRRRP